MNRSPHPDPSGPGTPRGEPPATWPGRSPARRAGFAVAAVAMLVASVVGSGALGGTPIDEAAGGALAADATPVAPAAPAFGIWSVIYAGLVALAAWQALPAQRTNARLARLDPLLIASLLLNGGWILSIQAGWLGFSVVVIVALLAILAAVFVVTVRTPATGRVERVLLDGTSGLYLGWVAVATIANITAWLAARGVGEPGVVATAAAVAAMLAAGVVGVALARFGHGRLSVSAAIMWGLLWVAVGRLSGDRLSVPTAVAAIVAVGAVAFATSSTRIATRRGTY